MYFRQAEDYFNLRGLDDLPTLAEIRAKLVRNRASWPLFDAERFRRHLESAFMTMWNRQVRGEAPAGFAVQPCETEVKRPGRD